MKLPLQLSERRALLILVDLVMVTLAILFSLWVWALRAGQPFTQTWVISQGIWLLFLPALWLLLVILNDFHNLRLASRFSANWIALLCITGLLVLVYLVIYFFSSPGSLPRGIVLFHAASSLVLVGLWRAAYAFLLGQPIFQLRAMVVGAGWAGRTIVQAIRQNLASGYQLVG